MILQLAQKSNPEIMQRGTYRTSQVFSKILKLWAKDNKTQLRPAAFPTVPNHFVFSLSRSLFNINPFSDLALSADIALKIMGFGK